MSLTKIAEKFFLPRQKEFEKHYTEPEKLQANALSYLISKGRDTEYGRAHAFENIDSYDDFSKNVPINTYEELKGDIDRMRHGEMNVLWPGLVQVVRQVVGYDERQVEVHSRVQCRTSQYSLQRRSRRCGVLSAQPP